MNKYSIKNIKSFKDEALVEIKPITIFVGKNSSGKSSLVRFPVVISQSMNSEADIPIMFLGKNVDYGNYEDVVFGHKKRSTIEFSVEYECFPEMYLFRISRESQYYNWYSKPLSVNYRIGLTKYSRKMIVDKCDVEIGGIACIKITRSQNERYEVSLFDINNPEYELKFVPRHLRFFKFIPYISLESQTEQILNAFCKKEEVSEEEKKRLKALTKNIYEISYLRGQ